MDLWFQPELPEDRGEVVVGVRELEPDLGFLMEGTPVTRHPFLLGSRL